MRRIEAIISAPTKITPLNLLIVTKPTKQAETKTISIIIPKVSSHTDWEVELGFVIGKYYSSQCRIFFDEEGVYIFCTD